MLDSSRSTLRRILALALLVTAALLFGGCQPANDRSSLAHRVSDALLEVGASPALMRCLTYDLEGHLTEADAEVFYEDLSSEPQVSEVELNRTSLLEKAVEERLISRAPGCRSSLSSRGRYSRGQIDRMLRRVGGRGYRKPDLFLRG
jgi:hypothetical protein